MKKKIVLLALIVITAVACAFGISACDTVPPDTEKPNPIIPDDNDPTHTHSYEVTVVAPSCTENGYTLHTCSCGDSYRDNEISAGHIFVNYVSDDNATCTEDGTKTAKCERCDATDSVTAEGTKLNHSFVCYVSDNNATCTEDGTKTAKCERCDATDTIPGEPARGHIQYVNGLCQRCGDIGVSQNLRFSWNNDDIDSCSVSGLTKYDVTNIGIPSEYQGHPVIAIKAWAFNSEACRNVLTGVSIPDSVTSIGREAFSACKKLTVVKMGNGVTTIGVSAFSYCTGLTSLIIPDSVTTIDNFAFASCIGLTSLTIPSGVTTIGENAFRDCSGLTSLTISDSVTSIGRYAFMNCEELTRVIIPKSVTEIESGAFSGCNKLTEIIVEKGNKNYHIDGSCLIETKSKILIAGTEKSIIPDDGSVTSIGSYAFYKCSGPTSLIIPDSVTSIGEYAFCGSGLTSVTIGKGLTTISRYMFSECVGMKNLIIPENVTTIESYAFRGSGLTSVTISKGVTSIKEYAFWENKLTSVFIPDSVTEIGNYAFGVNKVSGFKIYCEVKKAPAGWEGWWRRYNEVDASRWYTCEWGSKK